MKIFGNRKTSLTLSARAEEAYSVCDPLQIIEREDGTYSIKGFETRDGMTAAEVNDWLEELADEILE